jgi:hypothetical protein
MRSDLFKGVVLGAAVSAVLMAATAALAGTGVGAVFNLGKTNRVDAQSTLKGATASSARVLQLTNSGGGSGLGITVQAGRSPIVVNSTAGKARNLDADKLDGIDSTQLRFVEVPVSDAVLGGGASFGTGFGPYAGIRLPDAGLPEFSCAFVLPPTYEPGATVTVRLVWHTTAASGSVLLRTNYLSVTRAGRTPIMGPSVTDGLSAVGGELLTVPDTPYLCGEKQFEITSPDGVTPLEPGDAIVFGLYRAAGSSGDTCPGDLCISGITVTF